MINFTDILQVFVNFLPQKTNNKHVITKGSTENLSKKILKKSKILDEIDILP